FSDLISGIFKDYQSISPPFLTFALCYVLSGVVNWYHFLFNSSGNSCISGSPQIFERLDFINTAVPFSLHSFTISSIHFLSGTTFFFLRPVSAPIITQSTPLI